MNPRPNPATHTPNPSVKSGDPRYRSQGSLAKDTEDHITAIHKVALGTRPDYYNIGDGYLLFANGHCYRRSGPAPDRYEDIHSQQRAEQVSEHGEYWIRVTDTEWLRGLFGKWITENAEKNPAGSRLNPKGEPLQKEIQAHDFLEILETDPMPYRELKKKLDEARFMKGFRAKIIEAFNKVWGDMDDMHADVDFKKVVERAGIDKVEINKQQELTRRYLRKTAGAAAPEESETATPAAAGDSDSQVPIAASATIERAIKDFGIHGRPQAQAVTEENAHRLVKPHHTETSEPAEGQAFSTGVFVISGEGYSVTGHNLDVLYPAARPSPAIPSTEQENPAKWLEAQMRSDFKVMRFFKTAFPDEDLMIRAFEIAGSLVYGRPSERRVFVVKGKGRSGKTTFADLIRAAIGPGCPVMRREDIAGTFDGNSLKGASCVVHSEYEQPTPGDRLSKRADDVMLARIKELVGEREIRVEEKHRPSEKIFSGDLQVLIHGNSHPHVGTTRENQAAWAARLVGLPMETRLPDDERITDLVEMIIADEEEMAAFSAISLFCYAQAVARGGVGRPEVFTETEESRQLEHDILVNWVLDAADLFEVTGDIRDRLAAREIKGHIISHLQGCPHVVPQFKDKDGEETVDWDVKKSFYTEVTHHLMKPSVYENPAMARSGGGLSGVKVRVPEGQVSSAVREWEADRAAEEAESAPVMSAETLSDAAYADRNSHGEDETREWNPEKGYYEPVEAEAGF